MSELKVPEIQQATRTKATSLRRVRAILETTNVLMTQKILRAWGCGYASITLGGFAKVVGNVGQVPEEETTRDQWEDVDDVDH